MSEALAVLSAERDIVRQLHLFCRAVDRLDVELFLSVWHPDGTLDYGVPGLQGRAADLAQEVIDKHRKWAGHQHQFTNPAIVVDGDRAVSESYVMALLRSPSEGGRTLDNHYRGRCLDTWSRRDDRWAIDHRVGVGSFSWQQEVEQKRATGGSRRDREDAVYELLATVGQPPLWMPPDLPETSA